MRVTTQMLNKSAAKAGVPIQQGNLMNHINKSGNSPKDILNSVNSRQTDSAGRIKYEKQEKAADVLYKQLEKLINKDELFGAEGETSSKEKEEFFKEAEKLADKYNSLLSSLENKPESLDMFYNQSLKELISANKDILAEVGITAGKDGKLSVDKNKMKEADAEKLKNVFGSKNGVLAKMQFIASRVADRAEANLKSTSGNYSPNGNMNFYNTNKYDFRG